MTENSNYHGSTSVLRLLTAFLIGLHSTNAFMGVHKWQPATPQQSSTGSQIYMSTVSDMSRQMADMRREMSQNEDVNLMMQALRGQNMDDSDRAADGINMRLVDVNEGIKGTELDVLKQTYDPVALKAFFFQTSKGCRNTHFTVVDSWWWIFNETFIGCSFEKKH